MPTHVWTSFMFSRNSHDLRSWASCESFRLRSARIRFFLFSFLAHLFLSSSPNRCLDSMISKLTDRKLKLRSFRRRHHRSSLRWRSNGLFPSFWFMNGLFPSFWFMNGLFPCLLILIPSITPCFEGKSQLTRSPHKCQHIQWPRKEQPSSWSLISRPSLQKLSPDSASPYSLGILLIGPFLGRHSKRWMLRPRVGLDCP